MGKKHIPFEGQEDSDTLKKAKKLYDKMYEARQHLETFRGMKSNAPKEQRIKVGDAIIALRNAEVELAEFMKQLDVLDNSKLHIYGRIKQGLKV